MNEMHPMQQQDPGGHLVDVQNLLDGPYDQKPGESEFTQNDVERIPEVEITQQDLSETGERADNWLIYGGSYENQRRYPGQGFTADSLDDLSQEYEVNFADAGDDAQASPLIVHGDPPIMYITFGPDQLYALDARTGDVLWRHFYLPAAGAAMSSSSAERGAAVLGDTVYKSTLDFGVLAVDRYTGEEQWYYNGAASYRGEPAEDADGLMHEELAWGERSGPTSCFPPLIYDGTLVKGTFGAEWGIKGFFDGIDLEGEPQWRANLCPEDQWVGDTWQRGGGTAWASGAIDPANDQVIIPTANPAPRYNTARPGWNLYTGGRLAVDVETGEYNWHYQDVPHDLWDYDSSSPAMVYSGEVDGETRQLVSWAPKSGWVFTVDAETGQLVQRSEGYVQHHNMWELPRRGGAEEAPWVLPSFLGGSNPDPHSYHPESQTMVVKGMNVPAEFGFEEVEFVLGERYDGLIVSFGFDADLEQWNGNAHVVAGVDPVSGEVKWQDWGEDWMGSNTGGSVTTASGVTFAGSLTQFVAYDTESGERLWTEDHGRTVNGAPVCWYDPGESKHYVAVTSASDAPYLTVYSVEN